MDERLLSLPFDHYQRYRVTDEVLSLLWSEGTRPIRILDVGGHSSSLKYFRPHDTVVLADPKDPPDHTHIESLPSFYDAYVVALGGQLPFPDHSFDVVTAHDTLEHVPEPARTVFLEDVLRIARSAVIVNGPVHHPETAHAEERLAAFWRDALGWAEHPLEEHLEHGLPPTLVLETALDRAEWRYTAVPNGNVHLWLLMMALEGALLGLPESQRLLRAADRLYNELLTDRDFGGICYRAAYVAVRGPGLDGALERVEAAFKVRVAQPPPVAAKEVVERFIAELERYVSGARARDHRLRSEVVERDAALREALEQRDAFRLQSDREIASRGRKIGAQEELIRILNQRVHEIHEIAKLRDRQIADANGAALRAQEEVTRIQQSTGYRMFARTAGLLRRTFPQGTTRGRFYRWLKAPVRSRGRSRSPALSEAASTQPPVSADGDKAYEHWIERNEPTAEELDRQRVHARGLISRPLISVVAAGRHPSPEAMRATRSSLEDQTYDRWQLSVVPVEPLPELRGLLHEWGTDTRVKTDALVGASVQQAANRGIEVAEGEYVVLIGLGDRLAPSALYRLAVALNRDPRIDVAYSDGDSATEDGRRSNPAFTPEWSPEMLLSADYPTGLFALRRSLLSELGGLRHDLGAAARWDLLLRASERTAQIRRVPHILRHGWLGGGAQRIARDHEERAIREHLGRRGKRAELERGDGGHLRIRWTPDAQPQVSIIIPTRHNRPLLERCLHGIAASRYERREVIVVETAGRTEDREAWYRQMAEEVPLRVLWWEKPFNYSAVNQWAADQSNGEILVFLNDDVEPISSGWLHELAGWAIQDEIGVVGAQLIGPDDRIQHGGAVIGLNGFADHLFRGVRPDEWTLLGSPMWYRNVTAVTAACMAMRRDILEEIGGWDDRFELMGSDVELCLRAGRGGYRVMCTPFARLRHLEAATRGTRIPPQDFHVSFWHYQRYLNAGDPYFNPNLSTESGRPALRRSDERHSLELVSDVIGRDLTPFRQGARADEPMWFAETCRVLPGEVEETARIHEANAGPLDVRTINWFIPDFDSPFYGGIHTVFRFADHFNRNYGVENRFIVMGTGPEEFIRSGLEVTFPDVADSTIVISPLQEVGHFVDVPPCDASVATLWVTAYAVSKFNQTRRKFYFMQDFEPMFYPAGTMYALAEETYRLGLYGLANTSTLQDIYRSQYGGKATAFTPSVDEIFRTDGRVNDEEPYTVFLYARPGHWRNCYELALSSLTRLKETLGDRVRIVTAGSWARGGHAEMEYFIDNQGLLEYTETAELYRQCHAGLTLTVSKHPSYLPLQLMASGALVVSNRNPSGSWLLRHGENSLIADATADRVHEALLRGLTDDELRQRLTTRALTDIEERHRDWETEMDHVFRFMSAPQRGR